MRQATFSQSFEFTTAIDLTDNFSVELLESTETLAGETLDFSRTNRSFLHNYMQVRIRTTQSQLATLHKLTSLRGRLAHLATFITASS